LSRVYQVKFEDVQGKTNYHWLSAETAERIRLHDQEVLSTKRLIQFEEVVPTPDGILHHWLAFPISD